MLIMTGSFEMKSMYEQNVDLVHEEQYAMYTSSCCKFIHETSECGTGLVSV